MIYRMPAILLLAFAALAVAGCSEPLPEEPADELVQAAVRLEQDNSYYQSDPQSPPGALEMYRLALARLQADGAAEEKLAAVRMKIEWFEALKLMTAEKFLQKADYPAAIAALTAFSEKYGDHPDAVLAIFFRGVARLYDIDFQDPSGAIADFETFAQRAGDHPMVAEALFQIGHVKEFNLAEPDYAGAVEGYGRAIERFGATNEAYIAASDVVRMAVERSLFNRARLLERLGETSADRQQAREYYQRAAADYLRLSSGAPPRDGAEDDVFFDGARFTRYQYVYFRLGALLADELGRRDEGIEVLRNMQRRWPDSPWFGKVEAKIEYILGGDGAAATGGVAEPVAAGAENSGAPSSSAEARQEN